MDCFGCVCVDRSLHPPTRIQAGWLFGLILLLLLTARPASARASINPSRGDSSASPTAAGKSGNHSGKLPPATRVLDARAETTGNGVRVIIKADGVMAFRPYTLAAPWRIVIDITGVRSALGAPSIPVASLVVNRIRIGQPEAGVVRVVLDMPALAAYTVDYNGDSLFITVGKFEAAPAAETQRPAPATPKPAALPVPASVKTAAAAPEVKTNPGRAMVERAEQMPGSGDDRTTVSRLLRRVEELEARVHDLEGKQPVAAAQPAEQPTTEEAVAPAKSPARQENGAGHNGHDSHNGHDDHDVPSGRPTLQLQGFADVDYRATNERGKNNAFALGQLDLFITSRLSDKFNVLSELIIQADNTNTFSFEIHRLLLQYHPNDYFNLNIGRYHTGIGYYNTAYHHGQWFQTAATRPFIFAFEGQGGILPLHNVGVSANGRIPSGSFGLRYLAEVGNGRSVNSPGDRAVQTANDENEGKAVNFGLLMRPDWAPGLQAGVSVYRDRLTPTGRADIKQTITAAHAIFRNSNYEWLNEALLLRHTPAGGPHTFNSSAFYTQFARRVGVTWPFFRYQYTNVPDDDPLYPTIGRRNGPTVGLRYDLTEFAAFKVQYDHTQRRRQRSLDELLLQLAFTF